MRKTAKWLENEMLDELIRGAAAFEASVDAVSPGYSRYTCMDCGFTMVRNQLPPPCRECGGDRFLDGRKPIIVGDRMERFAANHLRWRTEWSAQHA